MNIGILAPPTDGHVDALIGLLEALAPGATRQLDLTAAASVVMDDETVRWGGCEVSSLDALLVRGFRYMDPVIPALREDVEWSLWQTGYIADQQRFSTLYSVLSELERRGVQVVNPPSAHITCFAKQAALERLPAAGFRVPPLLCANNAEDVHAFCARPGKTLWRTVTGRAAWQLFTAKQREALVDPGKPPILLAKAPQGSVVRCWLYEDEPLLCVQHAVPDRKQGEYLEVFAGFGPDAMGAHHLKGICSALGATWLHLNYVLAGDGIPVVLDFDTDPLIDWLPVPYREHLLHALARSLLGLIPDPGTPEQLAERPTVFLRRMLNDLWDYEASKYQ